MMKTIEEIEAAIDELSPTDFERVSEFVEARIQDRWDAKLERDAKNGRLDALFAKLTELG